MSAPLPRDAQVALSTSHSMSLDNEADGSGGPWTRALALLTVSDADHNTEGRARRRGWALAVFLKHTGATTRELREMDAHPLRSCVRWFSEGDRPADISNREIAGELAWRNEPVYRDSGALQRSIAWRAARRAIGSYRNEHDCAAIRETHRDVHRAICGEDYDARYERIKRGGGKITEATATEAQTGPTIKGCPWCKAGAP